MTRDWEDLRQALREKNLLLEALRRTAQCLAREEAGTRHRMADRIRLELDAAIRQINAAAELAGGLAAEAVPDGGCEDGAVILPFTGKR